MKNFVFDYTRVSTEAQNLDRQLDALNQYCVNKIYNKKMTGTKRDRPELVELFEKRGVHIVSLKESSILPPVQESYSLHS